MATDLLRATRRHPLTRVLALRLLEGLSRPLPSRLTPEGLLSCACEVMGDDLAFYPHSEMLVWDIARHEGYDIPPYPMAGYGEARNFLASFGVVDVPSWYQSRGLAPNQARSLFGVSCLMARNRGLWRRIFAFPSADGADAGAFAKHLAQAVAFALGDDDGGADPRLFRC